MTTEEANKIFKDWLEYVEINDKLSKIFWSNIPESFLPYPKDALEEALNIVAKNYFDAGDHNMSDNVLESMCTITFYKNDEEAIEGILNSEFLKNIDLRKKCLENLKKSRDIFEKNKKVK